MSYWESSYFLSNQVKSNLTETINLTNLQKETTGALPVMYRELKQWTNDLRVLQNVQNYAINQCTYALVNITTNHIISTHVIRHKKALLQIYLILSVLDTAQVHIKSLTTTFKDILMILNENNKWGQVVNTF